MVDPRLCVGSPSVPKFSTGPSFWGVCAAQLRCDSKQKSAIKNDLERTEAFLLELTDDVSTCERLVQLLEAAMQIRNSVRRKGLFSYIFGSNPNVSISQYLHAAEELAALSLSSFEHNENATLGGDDLRSAYKALIIVLQELRDNRTKIWGFRHLDTIIAPALEKIKE